MNKYFVKYDSTSELHKELTNILLLAPEESNFFTVTVINSVTKEEEDVTCVHCVTIYLTVKI